MTEGVHLPFPDLTDDQRRVMIKWLYAAADRESRLQQATRAQDRARHSIRANTLRDMITELTKGWT